MFTLIFVAFKRILRSFVTWLSAVAGSNSAQVIAEAAGVGWFVPSRGASEYCAGKSSTSNRKSEAYDEMNDAVAINKSKMLSST